ncbi:MAG: SMC-Scp complex subunit ScpB, partial [Candidatus Omnitrophica bacterium]|nr:SMC-Scp complex subunit ScpB [Candidatus Omnitrophota bacterium]
MPENNISPIRNTKALMDKNNISDGVKSVIEALLFAIDKPLTIEQAKSVLDNLEPSEIRALIEELKSEYDLANRGIRITEVAGGFQMITAPGLAQFLKKLFKARHVERLSKPALETLAIIAYKQPVTKVEIESLRNVNVDGVMTNLLDKNLIRISGRKKAPGRPYVFGTTRQFLEYFGLKSLEELPKMQDFSSLTPKDGP